MKFGTLFHHGDELLRILVKLYKHLWLRNNGGVNVEGGALESLREHMITQLIKTQLEMAARQRLNGLGLAAGGAQAVGGSGGGGAKAPAPAPLPALGAKGSSLDDDLLQDDAFFADAWLALGKGPFQKERAHLYQSVKIAVPETYKVDTTVL